MADYIKREDALSLVQHSDFDTEDDKNYIMLILGKEYGCPSADVAPVVRCKDCKWWTKQEASCQGRCALLGTYPTGGWYCANGERKDNDTD